MILENVQRIVAKSVEEVISSPLSLDLLRCYSILYLNGSEPRTCAKSQRSYYTEICLTGITKAMEYDKKVTRICKPAWDGIKYVIVQENPTTRRALHVSSEYITDDQARVFLAKGALTENDFKVLPDDVKLKSVAKEVVPKKRSKK